MSSLRDTIPHPVSDSSGQSSSLWSDSLSSERRDSDSSERLLQSPSDSTDSEGACPSPTSLVRSASHEGHTKTPAQQLDRVLKRTTSYSAHILAHSKKPFIQAQRTLKAKGKEVFRPVRTRAERAAAARRESIPECPSSSADGSSDSPSSSDRSSTTSDKKGPSAAVTKVEVAIPRRPADVSRARSRRNTRRSSLATTSEQSSDMSSPSSSAPSTPERASRASPASAPTPRTKGAGQRNPGRRRAQSTTNGGEPIRYARPACPENSLPCVIFEQRYENPFKIFRVKPKADSGEHSSVMRDRACGADKRLPRQAERRQ
ncbi:hypothetical protein BV20DRAFT_735717 [Pilatotrama ljubarskyi]|nr:hypothetical protein BV20DRAFT_735717 [Pilatotrama ljubarskyi]